MSVNEMSYWSNKARLESEGHTIQTAYSRFCPGTMEIVMLCPANPTPIGIIWVRGKKDWKEVEIIDSYVNERWRRLGVRTKLNEFLIFQWGTDLIYSDSATKSGKKFMKAFGYKYSKKRSRWEYKAAVK